MVPGDPDRFAVSRPRTNPVLERRRRMFSGLVAATGSMFLLAVFLGGWLWLLFLLSGGVLGGYVALLLNLKAQRQQAREVVRELRRSQPAEGHEGEPTDVEDDEVSYARAVGEGAAAPEFEPTGDVRVIQGGEPIWPSGRPIRRLDG